MTIDMTCAECAERLPEYIAGLGDAGERERIERHIRTCDRCRAELKLWRAIGEAMEQDVASVPPDTREIAGWSRLVAQLPARRNQPVAPLESSFGGHLVRHDHLRTIELDENSSRHPEQSFQPPANRPTRRWMTPIGVIAALLIVVLGSLLFASHASKRSTPALGGATPGPVNVRPGPPLPKDVTMTNVTLAGPGEYWATGFVKDQATGGEDTGVILRFSNGKWTQVGDLLQSGHLNGLAMVSATEGWAWGGDTNQTGLLLHISNGAWQRVAAPAVNRKGAPQLIRMNSATDGWLVIQNLKDEHGNSTPSSLLHFTNGSWNPIQSPLTYFVNIAPVGPDEAWIFGGDDESQAIVHVTASKTVVSMRIPQSAHIGITGLRASAPNDVWAYGVRYDSVSIGVSPVEYHYDGASWQTVDVRAPNGTQLVQVISSGDMWATHNVAMPVFSDRHEPTENRVQALYHLSSGLWREVPVPYNDLTQFAVIADASTARDVWAFGTYSVWTTNSNGSGWSGGTYPVLLHYLNGAWTEYGR